MNCLETQKFIDAYLDDELDVVQALNIEQHLQTCKDCAMSYETLRVMQHQIRQNEFFFEVPSGLRSNIQKAIRKAAAEDEKPRRFILPSWFFASLSTGLAVCLILLFFAFFRPLSRDELLTREIVSEHVRSLIPNHLIDVPSTDQHTVKPWFDGKLDFSPPVKDLAAFDFTLLGGRLDYIDTRPVAALVYRRREHLINLFIIPSGNKQNSGERNLIRQGYNIIHWSEGEMEYWAVSDLNLNELEEFVSDFRK